MDWDKLKLFHAVAKSGSFTAAAKRLNTSQSALSRQIKGLEDSLNIVLFNRHARGLVLTQEGEQLFETVTSVVHQIENATDALLESKEKPRGRLSVTTTVTFGSFWLTSHLDGFIKLYPDIELELNLSDDELDLATRAADVAIRFQLPEQADFIQRQLLTVHHHIYASPKYLTAKGTPEKPEDLDHHDLIVYGPSVPPPIKDINWIMQAGRSRRRRKPVLQINNLFGVLHALKAGMGLAAIPDYLAAGNPDLVRVLPEIEGPAFKAYFVYPSELKRSARVQAFRDYLLQQAQGTRGEL